ncbi:MAG TPA: hypothetical protein VHS06_00855 [Chloroflexota bacterium]|nr:hypothetical protein [Chloroflexota bacterium]
MMEKGVDPGRRTETFVEIGLELTTERWREVPFFLRAGKALSRRRKGVVIHFRPGGGQVANELWIGIDGPRDIVLRLAGRAAGRPVPIDLAGEPPRPLLPAYARVLLDVLSGGNVLSVRADEAEEAWRVVTPVLEAWHEDRVPLQEYPAGSDGPPRESLQ